MRPSRTTTYSDCQNALLKRRGELFNEAERITERLGEIKNDVKALDATLKLVGYTGELDAIMPRAKRNVMFGTGELTGAIMLELRHATGPLRSREIAQNILAASGDDIRDRRAVSDLTRRVSKALRKQREAGVVLGQMDGGRNILWTLRPRVG